jgi:hypothetical protein
MRMLSHITASHVVRWLTILTIAAAVGAAVSTARPSAVMASPQVQTQITVSSSQNPGYYGQAVTLTADVAPIRGGGHVEFLFGDAAVCQNVSLSQVTGAIFEASCTTRGSRSTPGRPSRLDARS